VTELDKKTLELQIIEINKHAQAAYKILNEIIDQMPDAILLDRRDCMDRAFQISAIKNLLSEMYCALNGGRRRRGC
jgi:hypothetical protein